jgi:5-methyltetrahydrofolate--homocysteine methyltransferase
MLFDESGQAASYERKIAVAKRSYNLLCAAGFPPEDIVFDPNVLTIATGMAEHDGLALDFIRACAWIRQNCPRVQISGGISNLSFSFRGNDTIREALHGVFLKYAMEAGLSMAIVNPAGLVSYDDIDEELRIAAEDVILCRPPRTEDGGAALSISDRLLALALRAAKSPAQGAGPGAPSGGRDGDQEAWRQMEAEERIFFALVKGIDDYIEQDTLELLPRFPRSLDLVEGPLMRGMQEVGRRFGEGKMFLPQVIRSARVMKKAVAVLEPRMEAEKAAARAQGEGAAGGGGKVLLATVKGDVHDIGKNIVAVVLGCNGYEVLDLGVMIPSEEIIDTAIKEKVQVIGLSGLITPSLDEMVRTAREMEERGLTLPLIIGGATTSLAHTGLRIAPEYSGPVVYTSDASQVPEAVRSLLSDTGRSRFLEALELRYQKAAEQHEKLASARELISLEAARENRIPIHWKSRGPAPEPVQRGGIVQFDDYPAENLIPFIDWDGFYYSWDLKMPPDAQDAEALRGARKELREDAQAMLARILSEKPLRIKGVLAFFPALSQDEDIILFERTGPGLASNWEKEIGRFCFLRNQEKKRSGAANPCLADFILPQGAFEGVGDWIGLFALSAGFGLEEAAAGFRSARDDYGALLLSSLADRLAEAFAEELHQRVRREFWAYAPEENLPVPELFKEQYRGIRPCFGYPSCPDHGDKVLTFTLLEARQRLGLELSESAMIIPASSVCGMYIAHPAAYYFGLGETGPDQLEAWAFRKGISVEEGRKRTGRI